VEDHRSDKRLEVGGRVEPHEGNHRRGAIGKALAKRLSVEVCSVISDRDGPVSTTGPLEVATQPAHLTLARSQQGLVVGEHDELDLGGRGLRRHGAIVTLRPAKER
jgi:hypothetical protein